MKRVMLLVLISLVSASMAFAAGGVLGVYADNGGTDCNILDAAPGLLSVFVVQTLTPGSTAVEFSAPQPACMVGASYLSWSSPFGVSVGDPAAATNPGNSTAYGACKVGTILVGSMSYFGGGGSTACCAYPVLPHSVTANLVHVTCGSNPFAEAISGLSNTVNGDATCPCASATEHSTWGAVKSIYSN